MTSLPHIIQGGMGVGVSGWPLAQAVSRTGQLGVVSGTGLDVVMARRLQMGDAGGHVRRALARLPLVGVAERILARFFVAGGKADDAPFKPVPPLQVPLSEASEELVVASNFVEVNLAREGHANPVGINYMAKIQAPLLASLYGAMLGGVDVVLVGAGIPTAVPGILDRLAEGLPVELRIDLVGESSGASASAHFDPSRHAPTSLPALRRPRFLSILSSATMARVMVGRATGSVDGFIVEGHRAGGHNAPPRGRARSDDVSEPNYGVRDVPDLKAIAALGLPFWVAGSFGSPERLLEALADGASGVQVGTPFAYCEESGLDPALKERVRKLCHEGTPEVVTDAVASPTGFPFKVLQLSGTLSEEKLYEERVRVCDSGYLRHAYEKADGKIGWRCPSEPPSHYLRKGGSIRETEGRVCVCNGLLASVGMGQVRAGGVREAPLLTTGSDVADLARFGDASATAYRAADVVRDILGRLVQTQGSLQA